jgi:hypothetical protein
VQVALLQVEAVHPLTAPARRRLLQLQLPQQDGWLEIRDLRLCVEPAAAAGDGAAGDGNGTGEAPEDAAVTG